MKFSLTNENKIILINIIKLFLISVFIEVIVFNITSYYTFFGKNNIKRYEKPEYLYSNNNLAFLKLDEINSKVYSLKLDLNLNNSIDEIAVEYKVFYSDETSDEFRGLKSKYYVENNEKSKYVPLALSGKTKALLVAVEESYYDNGLINYVSVNEKIPFEFNCIRFIVIFGILVLNFSLKNFEIFKMKYSSKNLKQEYILLSVLIIFLIGLALLNIYSSEEIGDIFFVESGIYNKELVDALYNKQLYLLQEPTEKFKSLENPYDPLARSEVIRNVDYMWDTAYYNGHHYMYFGILPVLLIFLPFYLVTKKYLKVSFVIFILSTFVFILLKEILQAIVKRYFKEISFKNVFYYLILIYSGTLIVFINGISRLYELVIISGLLFVLMGIVFIFKSLENEEKRYINLFWASLFMALSVACRPTDLLVSILILPYLLSLFINIVKDLKNKKIELLKLIVSVGMPYISVGIALMFYNYIRFNNPFEFGYSYQLTVSNNTALKTGLLTVPIGLFTNFFSMPRFILEFPFVENNNELLTFYGYYYIENMVAGLFIIAPICFSIFYIFKANKKVENKELKILLWDLAIVGTFFAIVSVSMSGSVERYLVDYAWIFVFEGIIIFEILYETLKHEESKNILKRILSIITVYSVIMAFFTGIISEKSYLKNISPKEYYNLRYTICFWE